MKYHKIITVWERDPENKYKTLIEVGGFDDSMILYGEGYGNKIQKVGSEYRKDTGFILFDVSINGVWLERENVEDIAKQLAIPVVPVVFRGSLEEGISLTQEGQTSVVAKGDLMSEGFVMRPATELIDRLGRRIISKIKNKDFAR
jgi:hypothetical protein